MNVGCDNDAGMRALVNHLTVDHGYRQPRLPRRVTRTARTTGREPRLRSGRDRASGAEIQTGPAWQGNYSASGGAQVIAALLDRGGELPRAIVCANDQTALGVIHALARRGVGCRATSPSPGSTTFPSRAISIPSLPRSAQPIEQMGATAFDVLYSMISGPGGEPNVVLPVRLMLRESCGCAPAPAPPDRHRIAVEA